MRSRRGFTLVELLVVIGIISLLLGMLMPALARAKSVSRFAACKANLRSQLQAHAAYANDSRDLKPPLWQKRTMTIQYDYVSPDIKWNGKAVGQGLLVEGKYLTIDALLDPSEAMGEDADHDKQAWEDATVLRSGSSYVYFWRSAPQGMISPPDLASMTYQLCRSAKQTALVMDINADAGHAYVGEYQGRPWISHPRVGRMNVGYLDGSVQDFGVDEVLLKYPAGSTEELDWVQQANDKHY